MFKKVFTILAIAVAAQQSSSAQVFTYSTSNDTVTQTTSITSVYDAQNDDYTNTLNIETYINNISGQAQPFRWTYITDSTTAPAGWILSGVCDNIICRPAYSEFYNHVEQESFAIAAGGQSLFEPRIFVGANNGTGLYRFKIRTLNPSDSTQETQSDFYTFIITKNPTGVSTISLKDTRVAIYPNPAQNTVVVYAEKALKANKVSIISITGSEVYSAAFDNSKEVATINIAGFAKGTYMARLTDANGKVITSRKFVKN